MGPPWLLPAMGDRCSQVDRSYAHSDPRPSALIGREKRAEDIPAVPRQRPEFMGSLLILTGLSETLLTSELCVLLSLQNINNFSERHSQR